MSKSAEDWCRCVIREGLLRGEPSPDDLITRRDAALAWHRLVQTGAVDACAPPIAAALRRAAHARALEADVVDRELTRVLDAAGDAAVDVLVIKGAALAHTHYREPHLRARGDSDLVIRSRDCHRLAAVLQACGYAPADAVDGSLVTQQAQWVRALGRDLVHDIDVHWQVFNRHAFSGVLGVDELFERSQRVPSLGRYGRAPHPVHALLLACVHRVAHHAGVEDLLWLYDIHLLAEPLSDMEAAEFVMLATERRVAAVCADSLRTAVRETGARLPRPIASWLERAPWQDAAEPTAAFLERQRGVDRLVSDLGALPGLRARARLLWQHAFPRPQYMLRKYSAHQRWMLPYLYVKRILEGAPRWFTRS
jgi:hypothetical protein